MKTERSHNFSAAKVTKKLYNPVGAGFHARPSRGREETNLRL